MNSRIMFVLLLCLGLTACGEAVELAEQTRLQARAVEAGQLHDAGQSEQAIAMFQTIVQSPAATDAQKAHALRFISLGYYELEDFPRSGEYAAKAAAYYPEGSYDYLVNMADAELMQGKVPQAAARLEQAVAKEPHKLPANNVLGLLYLGDNGDEYIDYRKALIYNRAAYRIEPGRITGIVLARNYLALQDHVQAREQIESLVEHYPEDGYIRNLLSRLDTAEAQADE